MSKNDSPGISTRCRRHNERWSCRASAAGNGERHHLRGPELGRRERHGSDLLLERCDRREREAVASPSHLRPGVAPLEAESLGHREQRGRVDRAGPAEAPLERFVAGPRPVPGDDRAADPRLCLRRRPEKGAAARGAHPLVQVARVDVRADRLNVEIDVPRGVRAVDHRHDAALPRERAQSGHRQLERAQRGDVAHEEDACPSCEAGCDRVEELVLGARGTGERCGDDPGAGVGGNLVPHDLLGAVLVVGEEDLVAAANGDAARDRIQSGRRVGDEADRVSRLGVHVPGDARAHLREAAGRRRARNSTGSLSSSRRSVSWNSNTGRGTAPKLP